MMDDKAMTCYVTKHLGSVPTLGDLQEALKDFRSMNAPNTAKLEIEDAGEGDFVLAVSWTVPKLIRPSF